ncbi:MAG TPA: site-2 protease family protein [Cellvibrio sp.]|nr:site-2 protease family protein [Cellvibrio sp.]
MDLLSFAHEQHEFALSLDAHQHLRLAVDGIEVSVKPLDVVSIHEFKHPTLGTVGLDFSFDFAALQASYMLVVNNHVAAQGLLDLQQETAAVLSDQGAVLPPTQDTSLPKRSALVWLGIGIKLLKTAKVLKVALATATVATYSILFTFEFALALVGVLVFHELGHLLAMKKFGIPTKGMYLIPFVGGMAVGEKPRTQWQDVYISMMGPVYGLLMTAVFFVIYTITGSHFCGLVASTSAFLNLLNLFPVYPLDGGRVVKALVFSRRNYLALVLLLVISAACLVLTWKLGLVFLAFFIVLGVFDIVAGWSVPLAEDITPLKTYGIWFSLAWYLLVAVIFLGMILLIADAGVPGAEIATKILRS